MYTGHSELEMEKNSFDKGASTYYVTQLWKTLTKSTLPQWF